MGSINWNEDPCLHCGACLSYCLWDRFERAHPGESGGPHLCRDCMFCYNICARVHPADSFPAKEQLFGGAPHHPSLGTYRAAWSGWASDRQAGVQDGGATTALLRMMVEQGTIDGALVVDRDGEWRPLPTLAATAEDLLHARGSKYTTAPGLAPLQEIMEGRERLAVVCLPCQATALRNLMRKGGGGFRPEKIVAIIGIFCYESFRYEGIRALVEDRYELPMSRVSRFDIKRNRLQFFDGNAAEPAASVPLAEIKDLAWPVCHSCMDFTAELSDISLGAVGSKPGVSTIIARTELGKEIVERAAAAGVLQLEEVHNMVLLERVAENKRKRRADLEPEESRYLTKQTLRGNFKKSRLAHHG